MLCTITALVIEGERHRWNDEYGTLARWGCLRSREHGQRFASTGWKINDQRGSCGQYHRAANCGTLARRLISRNLLVNCRKKRIAID
jgi:hypothetical protein